MYPQGYQPNDADQNRSHYRLEQDVKPVLTLTEGYEEP
jgi:hypothetical protein